MFFCGSRLRPGGFFQVGLGFRILLMIEILHYLKDPKRWELWSLHCSSSVGLILYVGSLKGPQNGSTTETRGGSVGKH